MDLSKLSTEELLKIAKIKNPKFAEEVSKQTRPTSSEESLVQVQNSAPKFEKTNLKIIEKRDELKHSIFDKSKVTMKLLDHNTAKKIIIENHYSHRMSVKQIALGFYYELKLNTVIIYGSSATARMKDSLPNPNYMELTRLFSFDWVGKNMESYCIAQSFNYIRIKHSNIKVLISFADPSVGHHGYIYQATNWLYCGLSDQTGGYTYFFDNKWQHPRTTVSKYGTRKHEEILKINPDIEFKRIPRKHRYLYFLGTKKEIKEMKNKLQYNILPYPKGDNINASKDTSNQIIEKEQ